MPDKRRTARFAECGKYFSSSKNSKYKLVFLRALVNSQRFLTLLTLIGKLINN